MPKYVVRVGGTEIVCYSPEEAIDLARMSAKRGIDGNRTRDDMSLGTPSYRRRPSKTRDVVLNRYARILEILSVDTGPGKGSITMTELGARLDIAGPAAGVTMGHLIKYLRDQQLEVPTMLERKHTSRGVAWMALAKIADAQMMIQQRIEEAGPTKRAGL